MIPGEYLERSAWRNFDFLLLGMTLALCAVGVVTIYSANLHSESGFIRGLYIRQGYWILVALAVMIIVTWIDYRFIERMAWPIYLAGISSLLAVNMMGRVIGGSQRWISVAGMNFQPSELMKIILVILLARIFDEARSGDNLRARDLVKPAFITAIPFLVVARQPDLGTAFIYLLVFVVMALMNGIDRRLLATTTGAMALLAPASWFLLKPYQQNRIIALLNPEADPMGQGYHIIQSKIAIGSGGMWGKGIFEGTQSKLNFLPAKHTDFIFSVFAEEVGFIGALVIIAVFYFFLMRLLEISLHARDKYGSLMVTGITGMMTFHLLYNIGMTIGLFPIVGIPLPFVSYGGSALITNMICVGLALNVSLGRYRLE